VDAAVSRDERTEADGESVWSWRPDAGAKFLRSKLLRDDGGKRARSPGRARYKRVPWKGTVLERVQIPSGKGRSGR
jgi:hypothetical protein